MSFVTASISRAGGRTVNEDSCGFIQLDEAACCVVADGLGGQRGGDTASKVAVDSALASFRANPTFSVEALRAHLVAAHQAILKQQKQDPTLAGMRSTIVVLISDSHSVLWAHMGDSRLYCIEGGRISCCTKDHSVPQAMVAAGKLSPEKIRHHEDRNRLLRCLGNPEGALRPTILSASRQLYQGTAFLLCTDGFWEPVTETEMEADFAEAEDANAWLSEMENRLLQRATEEGDNYTAITVVFASAEAPLPPPPRRRLRISKATARRVTVFAAPILVLVLAGLGLRHYPGTLSGIGAAAARIFRRSQGGAGPPLGPAAEDPGKAAGKNTDEIAGLKKQIEGLTNRINGLDQEVNGAPAGGNLAPQVGLKSTVDTLNKSFGTLRGDVNKLQPKGNGSQAANDPTQQVAKLRKDLEQRLTKLQSDLGALTKAVQDLKNPPPTSTKQ